MTIRRGEDWGEQVAPPTDLVEVTSDADAAESVVAGRAVRLCGGDLWATLGAKRERQP